MRERERVGKEASFPLLPPLYQLCPPIQKRPQLLGANARLLGNAAVLVCSVESKCERVRGQGSREYCIAPFLSMY